MKLRKFWSSGAPTSPPLGPPLPCRQLSKRPFKSADGVLTITNPWDLIFSSHSKREYLPSATKLRRLCFVCPQGGLPQCMLGYQPPPPDQAPPWDQAPPGAGIPHRSRHPSRTRHPLQEQTPQQTATVADGTYPTGMHSCLKVFPNWIL